MNQIKDPRQTARKILKNAGIADLRNLQLEDFIRWHPYCYLQESPMNSSQGRIQFLGSSALITINTHIKNKGQKRFVMAHEFGHFNLHFGLQALFNCEEESFKQWLAKGGHEQEANEFAAELLIPKKSLLRECTGTDFSIDLIYHLSDYFETSLTATARRVVEQGPYCLALVYSEKGIVKWAIENTDFPLRYIVIKGETPTGSAARRYFETNNDKPKVMAPDIWYFNDFNVSQFRQRRLRETVLPIPYYDGILSFFSLD